MKWYFGIGYSNGRKYQPIWVLFLILDLNQNSALGRTLPASPFILPMVISNVDMKTNKSVIVYETIFWWLPWFTAKSQRCLNIWNALLRNCLEQPDFFIYRSHAIITRGKVIYTKYSKHWPYTVAQTIDYVCRKC